MLRMETLYRDLAALCVAGDGHGLDRSVDAQRKAGGFAIEACEALPARNSERGTRNENGSALRAPSSELIDPDGNPDTSFLAKIPADVAFTFQTLDKRGMVLNMAQTWHQVRPGERRNDCGGCHAHSQKPTLFEQTYAARSDYKVFDLTGQTPVLAGSGSTWFVSGSFTGPVVHWPSSEWATANSVFTFQCVGPKGYLSAK